MIKVYTGPKGLGVFLLLIVGMLLFLSLFFWGIAQVIELFLPLLIVLSYLLIVVFVFGFLPATIFKDMRPSLSITSMRMSRALGASTWIMCFFIAIKTFGLLGVLFAFSFQYLAPIALVGALLKKSWHLAGHLGIWISFTYAMRYYSQWLLTLSSGSKSDSRIIDIDAIEVKN